MSAIDLARETPTEGRHAILSAMRELRRYGYSELIRYQDGRGQWRTVTRIHGVPQLGCGDCTQVPGVQSPNLGQPASGAPTSGNCTPKSSSKKKAYQEEITTTTGTGELDWCAKGLSAFTQEDRKVVVAMIESHGLGIQQDLLDEVAACIEDKSVPSPLGLLANLSSRAANGAFFLSRGRRIRNERLAKFASNTPRPRPSAMLESPYSNAIAWAYQQFNITRDQTVLAARMAEAAAKWPDEASRNAAPATDEEEWRRNGGHVTAGQSIANACPPQSA